MFHFTLSAGYWLNAVETFFSALTPHGLERGVFRPIVDLQAAITRRLDVHNADPNPSPDLLELLGFGVWCAYGRTGNPNIDFINPPGDAAWGNESSIAPTSYLSAALGEFGVDHPWPGATTWHSSQSLISRRRRRMGAGRPGMAPLDTGDQCVA